MTRGKQPLSHLFMTNVDRLTKLCLVQLKEYFIILFSSPDVPLCCNLKSKPFSQTISNALDISRKTSLNSRPSSNAERISGAIDCNWLEQESPGLSPDCFGNISAFFGKSFVYMVLCLVWDYSHKKHTLLTPYCCSFIFFSKKFCKSFFVLDFVVNTCSISCLRYIILLQNSNICPIFVKCFCHFSHLWSFNFPNFTCLTLPPITE